MLLGNVVLCFQALQCAALQGLETAGAFTEIKSSRRKTQGTQGRDTKVNKLPIRLPIYLFLFRRTVLVSNNAGKQRAGWRACPAAPTQATLRAGTMRAMGEVRQEYCIKKRVCCRGSW